MIKKHGRLGATRLSLEAVQWPPLARRSASVTACIVTNRIIVRALQNEDQMPRIAIPKREDAPAESKPILDNVDKVLGFVPNAQRLMSISPNVLSGWAALMGSLAKTLDVKTRDGIAL